MKRLLLPVVTLIAGMIAAPTVSAAVVTGDLIGVFDGNSNETTVSAALGGIPVERLAKVDWPALSNDGLEISDLELNSDGEATGGQWSYSGPFEVDYIIVKAGDQFAIYHFTDLNTDNMRNMGLFTTEALVDKGLSHIGAYRVVPIPAALWLMATALAGLGFLRRR